MSGDQQSADFRRALGGYATGVAVITTALPEGAPGAAAITVNSFASVSLSPRLVLWSLGEESDSFPIYSIAELWGVNVLAPEQEQIARKFAAKGRAHAEPAEVDVLSDVPVLTSGLARLACRTFERRKLGDHLVIVGEVIDFDAREGSGLTYFRSRFGIAPHPET